MTERDREGTFELERDPEVGSLKEVEAGRRPGSRRGTGRQRPLDSERFWSA